MKTDKNVLVLGALAGLMLLSGSLMADSKDKKAAAPAAATTEEVKCYGVNSCKGAGVCAGKVDSCSGKNGCNAEMKCAGANACKGKGLKKMGKKECLDAKGTVAV